MKISRSQIISYLVTIFMFIVVFAYAFLIVDKEEDNAYALLKEQIIEEQIIEVSTEEIDENKEIVYDNMTLEELTNKLNNSLKYELSGYGALVASYSLEKGIDPYLATAIMLHETGCTWGCSSLVKKCNNVGGMKGKGCNSYSYFSTLEQGIKSFIDNIYNNYYAYGLTTADLMGSKYAEDPLWSSKVNSHIEKVKNR